MDCRFESEAIALRTWEPVFAPDVQALTPLQAIPFKSKENNNIPSFLEEGKLQFKIVYKLFYRLVSPLKLTDGICNCSCSIIDFLSPQTLAIFRSKFSVINAIAFDIPIILAVFSVPLLKPRSCAPPLIKA